MIIVWTVDALFVCVRFVLVSFVLFVSLFFFVFFFATEWGRQRVCF